MLYLSRVDVNYVVIKMIILLQLLGQLYPDTSFVKKTKDPVHNTSCKSNTITLLFSATKESSYYQKGKLKIYKRFVSNNKEVSWKWNKDMVHEFKV